MSLAPTSNFARVQIGQPSTVVTNAGNLFVRSIETITLGTGALSQSVATVAANELRPIIDVTVAVTSGQFLSNATLTIQSANHNVGDIINFDFTPSDIPAGRSLFIKESVGSTTIATLTNASSGLASIVLNASNVWVVTDTLDVASGSFSNVSVSGVLSLADGTAAAPSLSFTSDPDTGLIKSAANVLGFVTDGSERWVINSSGALNPSTNNTNDIGNGSVNPRDISAARTIYAGTSLGVGTGTTSPVTELQVVSTVTTSPRGIMSSQYNTGTDGARFHGRKGRGTLATPTTVVTGDNLTRWVGSGYDGSNYLEMASIVFGTEGTIAATRVPTNITFQTATDAAPSVLTDRLKINSAGVLTFHPSAPGATITASATGEFTVAAAGTNQNITLTPSGTGFISVSGTFLKFASRPVLQSDATTNYIHSGTVSLYIRNASDGSNLARFTNGGNLILDGALADGIGKLQFAAATTSAGGITFGTDSSFYRIGTGGVALDNVGGTNPVFDLKEAGTSKLRISTSSGLATINTNGGGNLVLQTSNTTAFTLDSSQNATFAGAIFTSTDTLSGAGAISVTKGTTKYTSTGASQALTLANGTDGQIKRIIHDVDGGSGILTPTTKTGFSTITFTNAGDAVTLQYVTTRGWIIVGSYGVTIA